MTPPINIDGTNENYSNVTIDGQSVKQITIDGQDVLSAGLPDTGLEHHYDATKLSLNDNDSVSRWTDEKGSEDLTAGSAPTYDSSAINGNPAVQFDKNHLTNSISISQSFYVYHVTQQLALNSKNFYWSNNDNSANPRFRNDGATADWKINASSDLTVSSPDTNPHIVGSFFDGSNSETRIDGTSSNTGDVGNNNIGSFIVGARPGDLDREFNGYMGELLIYSTKPDVSALESHLSDKWGITI